MENANGLERKTQGAETTEDLESTKQNAQTQNTESSSTDSTQNTEAGAENTEGTQTTPEYNKEDLPSDDSSNSNSKPVCNRLSLDPSYTQEEATAIAVLKESRLAKNAEIQKLRKAYAQALNDTQPNTAVLNELASQIELIKQEVDEIDASIKVIENGAFNKNDSFKPICSVLKPHKKPLITEAELINELGANEIRSLSDIHGEGIWNRAVIDDSIADATALIASFFKIPANPTYLVRDICVKLSIVELKRRNSYPKEELDAIRNECLEWLNKMAQGKIPTSLEEEAQGIKNKSRAFIHKFEPICLKRFYD